MNFRERYVKEYLDFCLRFKHFLNEWESGFIASIEGADPNKLTARQFNKLKETAERVTNEVE